MKHFLLLALSIFMLQLSYSQSKLKINKIDWVWKNNEYFNVSKKKAVIENKNGKQTFTVSRFEKNYFILSKGLVSSGNYVEQRYDIVYFTLDTLFLSPVGVDAFQLGQLNEHHQYFFENRDRVPFRSINLVRFYFETTIDFYVKISLGIDFRGNSRVTIIDDYSAERTLIKSPLGRIDCNRLIAILEDYDFSKMPCDNYVDEDDMKCCHSVFEIVFNNQYIKCQGCAYFPFNYPKLENFIRDVIFIKVGRVGSAPTIRY
jgi:hypothetical protein